MNLDPSIIGQSRKKFQWM